MPPSSPKRQVIVDAIAARFPAVVTEGSDYFNTLTAANVFVWRQGPVQAHEFPCIGIRDSVEPVEPLSMGGNALGKVRARLTVEIAAGIETTSEDGVTTEAISTKARQLLADMIKAIGAGAGQSWGVDNCWTIIQSTDIGVDEGEKNVAWAYLKLEIQYPYNRFDYSA